MHELVKFQSVKKGKISNRVLENLLLDDDNDHSEKEDDQNIDSERDDDDSENDDYEEINFALPNFDDKPKCPNATNNNHMHCWILLWLLEFQQRFKLSNVAIDSLFKFLSLLLSTINKNNFLSFPSSLYMAKKELGIPTDIIIQYAACSKCHKLYDINKLLDKTEVQTCGFINFPNHTMQRFRQPCNNPLTKEINNNNQQVFRLIKTYPLGNIRQQLTLLFGRKDFEISCREWADRKNDTEALFDIYDGMIWKEFKDDNDELFFTKEYADTNLGLMINMD